MARRSDPGVTPHRNEKRATIVGVVCAWCRAAILRSGTSVRGPAVSHGLCVPCALRLARSHRN